MNINVTLLGQMITFAIFIWFTMKFIWPPVIKALQDRQKKIAEGLDAAERGIHSLELSKQEAVKIIHKAKEESSQLIDQAHLRGSKIVEEARTHGRNESHRLVLQGQAEIEQNVDQAKLALREHTVEIAIASAARILGTKMDKKAHDDMLNELIEQI